ncbi:hypothetical protein TRAPUB_8686 [Trametes pubescens]|uniref:Uncharacterized protein n=1 Tax=Trametes pubescens TaxID=154538 RepID=A0A1M2W4G2_TRAPU|nr:hypothetical protein TRAPUB_8686 [Trametes pubescens]
MPLVDQQAVHAWFMASLYKLLSFANMQGNTTDMLQELEVLTVILPHAPLPHDVPLYEEELARFARALAEGAFPALVRVRVGMEGALDDSTQDVVERTRTAAALQPLREHRLGVDVVGLHADSWEPWCSSSPPMA